MPVEIREIVIKTVIQTQDSSAKRVVNAEGLQHVKRELMDECRRLIMQNNKKVKKKR